MGGVRELVHQFEGLESISGFTEGDEVPGLRGRVAADVDDPFGPQPDHLAQGLGADPTPGRVEHDGADAALVFRMVQQEPPDVGRMEFDAVDPVALGASARVPDGLLDEVDPDHGGVGTAVAGEELGNGARAAEQVHGHRIRGVRLGQRFGVSVRHDLRVEPFRATGVGLEEAPHPDFEVQSVELLYHMVPSEGQVGPAVPGLHPLAGVVVEGVDESGQPAAQFVLELFGESG